MISLLENILFGQAEVNHVDFARFFAISYHKVIRLDITMNKRFVVYMLNSFDHLIAYHQSGFQIKFFTCLIEQVL